jgi:hypothetical protein
MGIRGVSFLGARFSFVYDAASVTVWAEAAAASPSRLVRASGSASAVQYVHPCDAQRSSSSSGAGSGDAAAACRARIDALGNGGTPGAAARLTQPPLHERAQWGRVRLNDGHVVVPRALVVVDAGGTRHPLTPGGAPVVLTLQSFSVQAAAAAAAQ